MTTLTVFYDAPWWVAVAENQEAEVLQVLRYIFGSEPSTGEIYDFVLRDLDQLWQQPPLSPENAAPPENLPHRNPKRILREAARQTKENGVSSKAQEAMRLLLEQSKQERQVKSKQQREEEAAYKRQKAKEKALARHKGR